MGMGMGIQRATGDHEPVSSDIDLIWHIPVDARFGGGGCRGEN